MFDSRAQSQFMSHSLCLYIVLEVHTSWNTTPPQSALQGDFSFSFFFFTVSLPCCWKSKWALWRCLEKRQPCCAKNELLFAALVTSHIDRDPSGPAAHLGLPSRRLDIRPGGAKKHRMWRKNPWIPLKGITNDRWLSCYFIFPFNLVCI